MVEINGLTKTFVTGFLRKKVEALRGIDLSVREGEILGFLGPNGAGKTTTLKILMGLIYPTSGTASIMGRPIGSPETKERVGFLPEQPYLYSYLTARELLDFYGRLFSIPSGQRKERIHALLDRVGLAHAADMRLHRFSKGMLQRIGIAQALINDPELVILDEPMSGLDPVGRREVRDIILGLKDAGKTVFFSTHILPDVEVVCDRVCILDRGRVKAVGTVPELMPDVSAGSVELTVEGLDADGLARVEGMSSGSIRKGELGVFVFGDRRKAGEAARLVYGLGGDVVSLVPMRGSLEDIFMSEVSRPGGGGESGE